MKKLLFLFLLGIVKVCNAQTVAKIRLDFPPMPVYRISMGLMQAQEEPFTGTISFDDGTVFNVTEANIPATYIRGRGLRYTVDACVGTGNVEGGKIVINLPPEPVRFRKGVMTALAIPASVAVTLPDGRVGAGTIIFPDCPAPLVAPGEHLASAVVAAGSVTFP